MKSYLTIVLLTLCSLMAAVNYTLDDLINAGLDNAYSVRQKEIMLKNSKLGARAAAWNLLPSADVSARRTNTDGTYSNRASLEFARTLSLTEPAYFNYRNAALNKSIASLDVLQARKQMAFNIYVYWLEIAQLQKEIIIQNENLAILRRVKEQTTLQQNLGQRTIYDVSQSEINVINAELAISNLQNQLAGKKAELFNLVKLPAQDAELLYSEADSTIIKISFAINGESTLPLEQLRQSIRQTKLDKLQSKLGLLPSLYVSGSYSQYSVTDDLLAFEDYEDSYTLAAGFSWSLWTPFTKGSSYAQTANSLMLKQWQLDEETAALQLDRENFKRDWTYLTETLQLNARKANQAKANLDIAREKYNLGSLSLLELEQARVDALDAELAVNKITYQLKQKTEEWNLLNSMPILGKY